MWELQNPVEVEKSERQCKKGGEADVERKNKIQLPRIQLSILNKCLQKAHPIFLDQMEKTEWYRFLNP